MIEFTVELCGRLADAQGHKLRVMLRGGACVADLRRAVADACPALAEEVLGPRVRICVDQAIVGEGHVIAAGAQVALFPPVSGG